MEKNRKTPFKLTATAENGLKKATVSLTGNLTLNEIPEIKLFMVQNLDKYQAFHFMLHEIENIDLGLVQLLYSFRWTAERKSKKISYTFSLPDEYKSLLERSGFTEFININK